MKLNLPKIVRPIPLADYAPEMEFQEDGKTPAVVWAWVNPPAALMARQRELQRQAQEGAQRIRAAGANQAAITEIGLGLVGVGNETAAVFAELWSQHTDQDTHWTAEEVKAVAGSEANPALYGWLVRRTIDLINGYRSGLRKN